MFLSIEECKEILLKNYKLPSGFNRPVAGRVFLLNVESRIRHNSLRVRTRQVGSEMERNLFM